MYQQVLPRTLAHDGVLAAHGVVELLATHEIDLDEADAILTICYGDTGEILADLQQMLVGVSSKPKIHKNIELGFQVQQSNVTSGWSVYMVSKSNELVQNFLQECKFQNHPTN